MIKPWLMDNRATCPTCRADARKEGLSDRRWMRRMVIFSVGPLVRTWRWIYRICRGTRESVDDAAEIATYVGEVGARRRERRREQQNILRGIANNRRLSITGHS